MTDYARDPADAAGPAQRRTPSRTWKVGLLLVALPLAIWLSFEIVTRQLAVYWEADRPVRALALAPTPMALIALAQTSYDDGKYGQAAQLARRALRAEPDNVQALRILGWIADQRDREAKARALFLAADSLSRRDLKTQYWLYERARAAGNVPEALAHADVMLRQVGQYSQSVMPEIIAMGDRPAGLAAVIQMLEGNPPWRRDFFGMLSEQADAPSALRILSAVQHSRSPPTAEEVAPVVEQLAARQHVEDAFRVWRAASPESRRYANLITDGEFAGGPAASLFGWKLGDGVGFQSEIAVAPDAGGRRALHATYDGFSDGQLAQQLLVLPPGPHQFDGRVRVTQGDGSRLVWTLACMDTNQSLMHAAGPQTAGPGWVRFKASAVVPETGCRAQVLKLVGDPGERRTDVEVWYAGLGFDRPAKAETTSP